MARVAGSGGNSRSGCSTSDRRVTVVASPSGAGAAPPGRTSTVAQPRLGTADVERPHAGGGIVLDRHGSPGPTGSPPTARTPPNR